MRTRRWAVAILLVLGAACSGGEPDSEGADTCAELADAAVPAFQAVLQAVDDGLQHDLVKAGFEPYLEAVTAAEPAVTVYAFLRPGLPETDVQRIEQTLSSQPGVVGLHYVSEAGALDEARVLFADEPQLLELLAGTDLPASFRLEVSRDHAEDIVAAAQALPGLSQVTSDLWTARLTAVEYGMLREALSDTGLVEVGDQAVALGCSVEELLDLMADRADRLEADSEAARALLEDLTER